MLSKAMQHLYRDAPAWHLSRMHADIRRISNLLDVQNCRLFFTILTLRPTFFIQPLLSVPHYVF
jgi:hypothetical protein